MAPSLIRMICPNLKCRKVLSVPVSARGKTVRCRNCGMRVLVPASNAPAAPPPPAKPAAPLIPPTDATARPLD